LPLFLATEYDLFLPMLFYKLDSLIFQESQQHFHQKEKKKYRIIFMNLNLKKMKF